MLFLSTRLPRPPQSRGLDQTLTGRAGREVIDVMLAQYPGYGNRYNVFHTAFTQFLS